MDAVNNKVEEKLDKLFEAIQSLPGNIALASSPREDIRKKVGSKSVIKEKFRGIIETKFRIKYPFY
jgi:hypothetical protein